MSSMEDYISTPQSSEASDMVERLREEAAQGPDPVVPSEVTKETQIIAIYGKGGIGKSFTLSNLSYMMAQQGKKVLLIGCDPKSDTTSLLFGGKACPTILETSTAKKEAGEDVKIGDVCFKRDGVYAMELGGPEVGRGCGGRGIIHGFELLEKLGFHDWDFDYVLLDFLGDVVCGGFGLPIARDMCQKVIVVGSNDLQSLYVANNVCSAVEYFRKLGGNVGVAGIVINKDDGTGEAAGLRRRRWAFPCSRPSPLTKTSAASRRTTRSSACRAPSGLRCSRNSRSTSPKRLHSSRHRSARTACLACSRRKTRAQTSS
jgi:chlorophyllide a reductase subunit X